MARSFYRNSAAVILVYSIANEGSLNSLRGWLKEVRDNAHEDIIVVLIGNKCDLEDFRKVKYENG